MPYLTDYLIRPRPEGMPLHVALRRSVEEAIADGIVAPGDSLPSERKLAALVGMSRPTVRKAFDELTHAGVIERRVGQGSFVASKRLMLSDLYSFSDRVRASGRTPSSRWLRVRRVAQPQIAARLELELRHDLVELRRTRLVDRQPVMVETSYFDFQRFPWLIETARDNSSVYALLRDRAGVEIVSIDETIASGLAGDDGAELGCTAGAPVLVRELLAFDRNGRPLEYSTAVIRGDRYVYTVRVTEGGSASVSLTTAATSKAFAFAVE